MRSKEQLQKIQNILADARGIVEKLDIVAVDDGEITADELQLIEVIDRQCREYSNYLEEILRKETIDDQQYEKLQGFEKRINSIIMDQAKEDGEISRSEQDVLNVLFDCLKNLKQFGSE